MNIERLAQTIKSANKFLGLSQESLAQKLDVSFTTVNGWLSGRRVMRLSSKSKVETFIRNLIEEVNEMPDKKLQTILTLLEGYFGAVPKQTLYDDPMDILFMSLLSLKASSSKYEEIYKSIKEEFHPWTKLLSIDAEILDAHVSRSGLGTIKGRTYIDIALKLQNDFNQVSLEGIRNWSPEKSEKYLCSLPGVNIKTARQVLMFGFGHDLLPVDSLTYKVGVRLGLVPSSISTSHVHEEFDKVVPRQFSYQTQHLFAAHANNFCLDTSPKCSTCPLLDICNHFQSHSINTENQFLSQTKKSMPNGKPVAIDLFAGCGGLSAGLEDAGFDVGYALDWDKHACETHRFNFPNTHVDQTDVRAVNGNIIKSIIGGEVDVVAGGPNCQGVSERGDRNPDDPRNFMFPEFVRVVSELQPKAFIMENVPGLAHRHNFDLMSKIFRAFEDLGYHCAADVLLAANYGVPQLRYRFFLIGFLDPNIKITFPTPTHSPSSNGELFIQPYVTVGDALSDIPALGGDRQKDSPLDYASNPVNEFQRYVRENSKSIHNHICSATSEINLARASHVPEGGNWKNIPSELLPDRFFVCRMTDHTTTYARPRRDYPAYTITSLFGNITAGAFTHPSENRAFTIREGARLQSFRDKFIFQGPRNSQYRQIGNAVPPLLAKAVANHVRQLMLGEKVSGIAPRITPNLVADREAWKLMPILTPRFKQLFGTGTRWPIGWGPEPKDYSEKLDKNYSLQKQLLPPRLRASHRSKSKVPDETYE